MIFTNKDIISNSFIFFIFFLHSIEMLYEEVIDEYLAKKEEDLIKPAYGEKSIVEIPRTFLYKFGNRIKNVNKSLLKSLKGEHIVFILLDAVGFNIFLRFIFGKRKYFKMLQKVQYFDVLTSTVPSTTVTALTSLYTAEYPGQHGIMGYKMYLAEAGSIIKVLSYSPTLCTQRETLKDSGTDMNLFLNKSTIFSILEDFGVSSYVLTYEGHLTSTFTQNITYGAKVIGDITLVDAITLISKIVNRNKASLIYSYIGIIDALSHKYGPFSIHVKYALELIFSLIQRLIDIVDMKKVNIVISADHGQLRVFKKNTYFFDKICKRCNLNWLIPPFGEKRFSYIYIGDESKIEKFEKCFGESFNLFRSKDIARKYFFGPIRNKKVLYGRIGDIILSGKGNNLLIYPYKKDDLEMNLKGHHGGLSPDEMLVPIIVF